MVDRPDDTKTVTTEEAGFRITASVFPLAIKRVRSKEHNTSWPPRKSLMYAQLRRAKLRMEVKLTYNRETVDLKIRRRRLEFTCPVYRLCVH